jgi:uncharacterized protein with von Willebrand factor type A (vWA) domain
MTFVNRLIRLTVIALTLLLSCLTGAAQERKITYGILLDNTGSMRSQFRQVIELGKAVVHQVHSHGTVSLFDIHFQGKGSSIANPFLRIEASADEQLLNRAIEGFYVEGGQTALLDAVGFIAQTLDRNESDEKVIILITDGEDRTNGDQKKLIKQLREHKISVFAIGLVQQLEDENAVIRRSPRARAIDYQKSITTETGGRVVFPKSERIEMEKLLAELALP